MTFDELLNFVKEQDKKVSSDYGDEKEKIVLARTLKLSEEVGEVSQSVLALFSDHKDGKMSDEAKKNLEEELSDVIVMAMLLAESTGVDIHTAMEKKIDKIASR